MTKGLAATPSRVARISMSALESDEHQSAVDWFRHYLKHYLTRHRELKRTLNRFSLRIEDPLNGFEGWAESVLTMVEKDQEGYRGLYESARESWHLRAVVKSYYHILEDLHEDIVNLSNEILAKCEEARANG